MTNRICLYVSSFEFSLEGHLLVFVQNGLNDRLPPFLRIACELILLQLRKFSILRQISPIISPGDGQRQDLDDSGPQRIFLSRMHEPIHNLLQITGPQIFVKAS